VIWLLVCCWVLLFCWNVQNSASITMVDHGDGGVVSKT
jgi:hypothetical protein